MSIFSHGLRATIRKGGPATRGYALVRGGRYRNWLLHRAVIDQQVRESNPFGWDGLPAELQIHHVNRVRHDCRDGNLLILDAWLHAACRRAPPRCPYTGRWLPSSPEPMTPEDHSWLEELTA